MVDENLRKAGDFSFNDVSFCHDIQIESSSRRAIVIADGRASLPC